MPEMHLRSSTKKKKKYKNSKNSKIHDTFIKTNEGKLAFKMIWLMEISKSFLEEQLT